MEEAMKQNSSLLKEVNREEELIEKDKGAIETKDVSTKGTGKLIVAEETATGRVRWPALKLYLVGFGGSLVWSWILVSDAIAAALNALHVWYLGIWARQYDLMPPMEVSVSQCV
jgi:hypothetical protein